LEEPPKIFTKVFYPKLSHFASNFVINLTKLLILSVNDPKTGAEVIEIEEKRCNFHQLSE
jgi:hypothetical protein